MGAAYAAGIGSGFWSKEWVLHNDDSRSRNSQEFHPKVPPPPPYCLLYSSLKRKPFHVRLTCVFSLWNQAYILVCYMTLALDAVRLGVPCIVCRAACFVNDSLSYGVWSIAGCWIVAWFYSFSLGYAG